MLALIPLFPLVGFLINGTWFALGQAGEGRKKASAGVTGTLATLMIFASFVVSLLCFLQLQGMGEAKVLEQTLFSWFQVGKLSVDMGFRLDPLNSLFTLVITGVGTLIHLYSIGYLGHDETPGKFFSYLLIGYWYTDIEKAKAGKKAFIVNRVGDMGFLLGMFLIFWTFGTFDFVQLKAAVGALGPNIVDTGTITAICLLLFVGCMGKSAQIPLYVWLPDAMAGPTPVSALIHAATMVTSGVYLVSRLNFLYSLSPAALSFMAIIGAFTAFFAATIAIVQTDIKKVLAYSTVSQLGYMFLACGVGSYVGGVFHVITHAFFKALLFLGAGSVIHGMHEEQDILKMGGLRKKMPWTFITFAAGWLAICGIPPFAGFFSKDEILWQAFSATHGSPVLWAVGAGTAVMTAFYMTRLFYLTFLGKPRFDDHEAGHHVDTHDKDHEHDHAPPGVHESPWVMLFPLVVLAVLSVVGGFISMPHMSWLEQWLEPVIPNHIAETTLAPGVEWGLMGVSVLGAVLGIAFAFGLYRDLAKAAALKKKFSGLHSLLEHKWYVDEIYEAAIIRPIGALSQALWKGFDVAVIDRVVVGFGRVSEWTGQTVRTLQTGSIQIYAFMLVLGVIATVGYLIYGLA